MSIVWEKSFRVEDCRQTLCTCVDSYGFAVLVAVHLDDAVESFFQRLSICSKTNDGQNNMSAFSCLVIAAYLEELGRVSGVDVVA